MTLMDSVKLTKIYETCPKCGCNTVGNGTGTLEVDTAAGYFKRTCGCGWGVEISETYDPKPKKGGGPIERTR